MDQRWNRDRIIHSLSRGRRESRVSEGPTGHCEFRIPGAGQDILVRRRRRTVAYGRMAVSPELSSRRQMADKAQSLQAITQDRLGGMWVSFGAGGLYRLARRYLDKIWRASATFQRQVCMIEFTDTAGRVWFGYRNNVLAVLDGDRVQTFGPSDGVRVGDDHRDLWTRIGNLGWRRIWFAAVRSRTFS